MPLAVEVEGVVKAFDHRPVLRGVDLRVPAGAAVAVLGANGSGKTTLLHLMATLLSPTRGTIRLFGEPASPLPALRRRIGLLPHESLLYDSLTVEENLRFFAGLYRVPPLERVDAALAWAALESLAPRRVRVLSRGQRQQVNLARVLLHDPDLLILDEPYTGLDLDAAGRLTAILHDQRRAGRTIVLSTHDVGQARAAAMSAAVLRDGRLGPAVPPEDLDADRLTAWFGMEGIGSAHR